MCISAESKTAKFKGWSTKGSSNGQHLASTSTLSQNAQNTIVWQFVRDFWRGISTVLRLAFALKVQYTSISFVPFCSINRLSWRMTLVFTKICRIKLTALRCRLQMCSSVSQGPWMKNNTLLISGNTVKDLKGP